jgi:hypothetical protein
VQEVLREGYEVGRPSSASREERSRERKGRKAD